MNRKYAWIPDLPDWRDRMYAKTYKPRPLPPSVDLRAGCSPVEDQQSLGSCTGNAIAGAVEFLERKDGVFFEDVSRLFIYYNERVLEDTVPYDNGAMIRDGIKSAVRLGICSEALWPYNITRFADRPSDAAYEDAAQHKVTAYARIEAPHELKACLADGFPFVFGFTVYESFESDSVAQTGVVPMPGPDDSVLGGHAVLGVGYDDTVGGGIYICRNSWGPQWGNGGYFYMPYDYLHNTNLASDMWTIRRQEGF